MSGAPRLYFKSKGKEMEQGNVKWFDNKRGYGFIARNSGEDLFVHYSAVNGDDGYKSLQDGQLVEFEVESSSKGPKAVNVTVLDA